MKGVLEWILAKIKLVDNEDDEPEAELHMAEKIWSLVARYRITGKDDARNCIFFKRI